MAIAAASVRSSIEPIDNAQPTWLQRSEKRAYFSHKLLESHTDVTYQLTLIAHVTL
jgi:hypothetical protein